MRRFLALLLIGAAAVAAQDPMFGPEERVVLRDFSHVRAVAASASFVFGATDAGLIIRDIRFHRWMPPRTTASGYPARPVRAAWADAFEEAVWLGTDDALFKYVPLLDRFERIDVPAGVRGIGAVRGDPTGDIWLLTGRGWARVPRAGFLAVPAGQPPRGLEGNVGMEGLRERYPMVDAMAPQVLTDDRLRTDRFTDATRVPGRESYWLGTTSRGLVELDALIARFDPHPFGLLSDGVAAIYMAPDGIWTLTDGRGRREGLTFLTPGFDRWRWDEGPPAIGFGASVFRTLTGRGNALWLGADRGLWRVEPERSHRLFTTGDGLPDASVYALAQGPSGLWVGTALGLALVADDESVTTVDRQMTVLALAAARDTVWVGTTAGLGVAWPGADGIRLPAGVLDVPALREPILGLALAGDTLVVVNPDRIVWRAGAGAWQVERVLSPEIGVLRAIVADEGGVWLGGGTGLAWFDFASRSFRVFAGPRFVPGSVRDLGVDDRYLWVATEDGLVRFAKRALVP